MVCALLCAVPSTSMENTRFYLKRALVWKSGNDFVCNLAASLYPLRPLLSIWTHLKRKNWEDLIWWTTAGQSLFIFVVLPSLFLTVLCQHLSCCYRVKKAVACQFFFTPIPFFLGGVNTQNGKTHILKGEENAKLLIGCLEPWSRRSHYFTICESC